MNLLKLIEAANFRPTHLDYPDSWVGHIPFANWLVNLIKPSIFLELGTHSGNSYLAFCQAVKESKLLTKCYAIDTWTGDEHAGFYGEKIFETLSVYHDKNYGSFSRLLRMTFDEGTQYFSDKSIELLHIDGMHTYEAVKHDFETWLPKLAPHAVVLLHDVNVRERGFGVWRFWQELCQEYPLNFEFFHSNGLGIIQLSKGQEDSDLVWMDEAFEYKKNLQSYFTALGMQINEQYKIEVDFSNLEEDLFQQTQRSGAFQAEIEIKNQEILTYQAELDIKDQKLLDYQAEIAESEQHSLAYQAQLEEQEEREIEIKNEKHLVDQKLSDLQMHLNQREQILQNLNSTLLEIYSSTAWKLIRKMWQIRLLIIPKGSKQEKFSYSFIRTMKRKPKSNLNIDILKMGKPSNSIKVGTQTDYDENQIKNKSASESQQNPLICDAYNDFREPWRKQAIERFMFLASKQFSCFTPISHFILLPLFSVGGAELVAVNFIKMVVQKNQNAGILVLITDKNLIDHSYEIPENAIFLNLEKFLDTNDSWKKKLFLYDLIQLIRPSVIHNINSSKMWELIIDKGNEIRKFSKLFANIFCFQFDDHGSRIGYAENYLRDALPYLDGVISDNKRFINDAIKLYGLQADSEKFHTIYTPFSSINDENLIFVRKRLESLSYRIRQKAKLNCMWAGRLDEQKKWKMFLTLVKESPNNDYFMYGKSVIDEKQEIPDLSNLHFLGSFNSNDEVFLNNSYDVFVFTSQWEGLPTILINAGLYGLPIIAPSVGGVAELVNNETGYLLPENATHDDYLNTLTFIKNNPEEATKRANTMLDLILERHNWLTFNNNVLNLKFYLENEEK